VGFSRQEYTNSPAVSSTTPVYCASPFLMYADVNELGTAVFITSPSLSLAFCMTNPRSFSTLSLTTRNWYLPGLRFNSFVTNSPVVYVNSITVTSLSIFWACSWIVPKKSKLEITKPAAVLIYFFILIFVFTNLLRKYHDLVTEIQQNFLLNLTVSVVISVDLENKTSLFYSESLFLIARYISCKFDRTKLRNKSSLELWLKPLNSVFFGHCIFNSNGALFQL